MANLKIIGAARVKALIAMLQTKRDEEIKAVRATQQSQQVAQLLAMREVGAEEEFVRIHTTLETLALLSEEMAAKTGMRYKVNMSVDSYQAPAYIKYNAALARHKNGDIEKKVAQIKADYATKENLLWLCETLEEAKAIVGVS